MSTDEQIDAICKELQKRYVPIHFDAMRRLLKGRMRPHASSFHPNGDITPTIEEARTAFRQCDCAILTAFRGKDSEGKCLSFDDNLARNAKLREDLISHGLSYSTVRGCYLEAGREIPDVEKCFFVRRDMSNVNQSREDFFRSVYRLSEKYDQDSFLIKCAGTNESAFLIATTDAGRNDLGDDIKFVGQFFEIVEDIKAWTDASDGRFAFVRERMARMDDPNCDKIKLGFGDLFDVKAYGANGLVAIGRRSQGRMQGIRGYEGKIPLVSHEFVKDNQTEDNIRRVVMGCLNAILKGCAGGKRGKVIGLQCTASIDGSMVDGARAVYDTVLTWLANKRHQSKVKKIVIVDNYFDYYQIVNGQ